MTKDQIKLIHIAKTQVGMNEEQYRLMLHNVAGVRSSKQLDNAGFEECMALLEEMGWDGQGPNYWRSTLHNRSALAGARMAYKIYELYEQYCAAQGITASRSKNYEELNALLPDSCYRLPGLVANASAERTRDVTRLRPREAWNLIETLKAILAREATY